MNTDIEQAVAEIKALAARPSYERARAEAMGFRLGPPHIVYDARVNGLRVEVDFRCVCGTPERFVEIISMDELRYAQRRPERFDYGATLRRLGSFDRDHLLADGYAPSKVDEIMALGEAFDQAAARSVRNVPMTYSANDMLGTSTRPYR